MDKLMIWNIQTKNKIDLPFENLDNLQKLKIQDTCVIKFKNPSEMIERQIFVGAIQEIKCNNENFSAIVTKIEQIDNDYEMTLINAETSIKVVFP